MYNRNICTVQFLCIRPGNTISPFNAASFRAISFPLPPLHVCLHACCVCVCVCMEPRAVLRGQRGWQVWRCRLSAPGFSLWPRQARPEPQSQRWKISRPWAPFRRWRVHTCPSVSTGLQIRDQKCRAQHSPSKQSEDLRHVSPSPPDRDETDYKSHQHSPPSSSHVIAACRRSGGFEIRSSCKVENKTISKCWDEEKRRD